MNLTAWLYRANDRIFNGIVAAYGWTLSRVLRHPAITLAILLGTIALNVDLFIHVPKGFFPQQDSGRLTGSIQADQDVSFQAMERLVDQFATVVRDDPAVASTSGYTGGSGGGGATTNTARFYIQLKPLEERQIAADYVIARLRPKLARVAGATLYLQISQDVRVGGHSSSALYQFVMRGENIQDLSAFGPRMLREMRKLPEISDVNTDQQNNGLQSVVQFDRRTASRFGISPQLIDNTLYDAFGQRQVSTMYTGLNQYHVVMEAAPQFWQSPQILRDVCACAVAGRAQQVPLSAFTQYVANTAPLAVNQWVCFRQSPCLLI